MDAYSSIPLENGQGQYLAAVEMHRQVEDNNPWK